MVKAILSEREKKKYKIFLRESNMVKAIISEREKKYKN